MEISHILYADDSVFCEADVVHIRRLKAILAIFEAMARYMLMGKRAFFIQSMMFQVCYLCQEP